LPPPLLLSLPFFRLREVSIVLADIPIVKNYFMKGDVDDGEELSSAAAANAL
jgi:hypothetical protein